MKISIGLFASFILGFGLSGMSSWVSASQPTLLTSVEPSSSTPSQVLEYSEVSSGSPIYLKWPRGSLIFPEINDPKKDNEVFLLNESLTSQSELQSLHYHLGSQFFARNKYREAKGEYLKALEFKPDIPAIYKNLGLVYFNSKNYKRAEGAYRKALELDPGYTTALAKLALSLAAQKKYTSAEKKFKQAIRAEPSNADHYLNLGHFYFYLKKNYRGAKRSYQKALKFNPGLVKAKKNLRDINRKFKKWKNQESDFENSWGSDYDYDGTKSTNSSGSTPSYPEEADIAGTWDEENSQHPLF
jgi:tetratricopeptide (TPR) repeat protein